MPPNYAQHDSLPSLLASVEDAEQQLDVEAATLQNARHSALSRLLPSLHRLNTAITEDPNTDISSYLADISAHSKTLAQSLDALHTAHLDKLRQALHYHKTLGSPMTQVPQSKLSTCLIQILKLIYNEPSENRQIDDPQLESYLQTETRREFASFQNARLRVDTTIESLQSCLLSTLQYNFLDAIKLVNECASQKTRNLLRRECTDFVTRWSSDNLGLHIDLKQAKAISALHSNTLVTARAGSGKTRTIVARTIFLVKNCKVSPSKILILAFNRKAAEEIRQRLKAAEIECPHVMTFHALAFAVVHPEESLIRDEPTDGEMQRSALTQRVVNDFLSKPDSEERVRSVMSRHFKRDWDSITTSGAALSQSQGLLLRRSLEHEAIDGTRVKSFGEKVIANFLFEHDVRYGYERNHWWGERNYKPDFSLTGRKVVIEYFGMEGDPDYDQETAAKREYWAKKRDWTLIEYGPGILAARGEDGLRNALEADLLGQGIPLRRVPEDELWRRIQDRHLTRFAEILTALVGRSRKALLTPAALQERILNHACLDETEQDVLAILQEVYAAYLDRMTAEGLEDFDGLMQRAGVAVANGQTIFERKSGVGNLSSMRYIMVDEYQDFTPLFDLLLSATLKQTENKAQVFCVGDDWQAINAFAGSDLTFFHEFTNRHTPSIQLGITTNYRSSQAVVDLGNRIMSKFGAPATPRPDVQRGQVEIVDLAEFRPDTAERCAWEGDQITPAIRRLIRTPLDAGKSVAVLARQRYLPFQVMIPSNGSHPKDDLGRLAVLLSHGLSDAARKQLHVGTVHQYKGREADVVIIPDAVERRYPKLHPDWVFGRVFGDEPRKIIDDERRLFYVGCSRAIERLIILTDSLRQSPFLEEVQKDLTCLDIGQLDPFCPDDGDWILIIGNADGRGVGPTMERAEVLKESQYSYHGGDWSHWSKRIPRKHTIESIVANLHKAPWFDGPDGLLIRICSSDGKVLVTGEISGSEFIQHDR